MDRNLKVIYQPQPGPQTEFIRCPCFEIFDGGARGSAKSFSVLLEWAQHAGPYGENAIGLIVGRERTRRVELIEESKRIYSPICAAFNEVTKAWRFPNACHLCVMTGQKHTAGPRHRDAPQSRWLTRRRVLP